MCVSCLLTLWARAVGAILDDKRVLKDVLNQRDKDPSTTTVSDFLRECAWAIFNSGMSFHTIDERWDDLQRAFEWWDYRAICQNERAVKGRALASLAHKGKVDAVVRIAEYIDQSDWNTIKSKLLQGIHVDASGNRFPSLQMLKDLDDLPWIGATNARYIAKNLGFDLAKDDVHLRELAESFEYGSSGTAVQRFASDISGLVSERIGVVETVLWNACERKANLSFKCPSCGTQR